MRGVFLATQCLHSEVPGEEIWKYLCVAGLAVLLGELIFTRWVAARRKLQAGPAPEAPAADEGADA